MMAFQWLETEKQHEQKPRNWRAPGQCLRERDEAGNTAEQIGNGFAGQTEEFVSCGPCAGSVRNRRNTCIHLKYRKTCEWPFDCFGRQNREGCFSLLPPRIMITWRHLLYVWFLGKVACWETVVLVNSWLPFYYGWEGLGPLHLSFPQYVFGNTWPIGGTVERTLVYRHGILNLACFECLSALPPTRW